MSKKITEQILLDMGWRKHNGIYTKIPYPFGFKWIEASDVFLTVDTHFYDIASDFIEPSIIENIENYDQIVMPVLQAIKFANKDDIYNYRMNTLVLSFNQTVRGIIAKIPLWDPIVMQNQTFLFIEKSFDGHPPCFRITNLSDFLKKEFKNEFGEVRKLERLAARLDEKGNEKLQQLLQEVVDRTKHIINQIEHNWRSVFY